MSDHAAHLTRVLDNWVSRLRDISDERAARRPAPGKWSPKEIIGHLIDSAANNHQRFVRGQFQADMVFPGYEQDDWVLVQHYNDAPWGGLVTLWEAYNRHLAHVMAAIPDDIRCRHHRIHNVHEIGWRAVSLDEPVTLDGLMLDYVDHLEHHLRQIPGTGA
jgi:hypothetical protein